MKIRKAKLLIYLLAVLGIIGTSVLTGFSATSQESERPLRKACLKASIRAIEMEIKRFEVKLKASKEGPGNPANAPLFEKRISDLIGERKGYSAMSPDAYVLPERKTVTVKVGKAFGEGSFLELTDMSKSGPFYHIAGIKGDNYAAVEPNRVYRMTIYLVYSRDYPFSSHYVYVSDF